jgi:hypothetical protein
MFSSTAVARAFTSASMRVCINAFATMLGSKSENSGSIVIHLNDIEAPSGTPACGDQRSRFSSEGHAQGARLSDLVSTEWLASFAPASTPRPVVERSNGQIQQALNKPAGRPCRRERRRRW